MKAASQERIPSQFTQNPAFGARAIGALIAMLAFLVSPGTAQRVTGNFIGAKRIPEVAGYGLYGVASFKNRTSVGYGFWTDFVISDYVLDPVTHQPTFGIHTLVNNYDGTFHIVTARPADSANAMVLVDLDGDGAADLVCAKWTDNTSRPAAPVAEVSFGNADGTFSGTLSFNLGQNTKLLDVGDVNGDGKPDLVFATSQGILVFLNGGNRTFQGPVLFNPTVAVSSFVVADVNGDGKADLIFSDGVGQVGVALGTSTGKFGAPKFFKTSSYPGKPVVGDVNSDGLPDVVVPSSRGIDILLGDGSGSFRAGSWPVSQAGTSAALVDFNRDKKLDLILVNSGGGPGEGSTPSVSVYPGHGDGTFSAPRVYVMPFPQDLQAVVDVNNDGGVDVVLADLTVLLGDGAGTFHGSPITRSANAAGVATGDFNGDGLPDVAVANITNCNPQHVHCPITVTMLPGGGADWFQAAKTYPTGLVQSGGPNVGMAVGDLNGDGHLDLVIKSALSPSVSVLLGNGDGTLKAPQIVDTPIGGDTYPGGWDVFLTDVNHDGKLDLVVDSGVLLGQGDGTFQSQIAFPNFPSPGPQRLAIADFNGDGNLDVAASLQTQPNPGSSPINGLAVLKGDGSGKFTVSSEWDINSFADAIAAAKMNGDALPDLVLDSAGITVLLNKGDGTFPADSTHYPYFGPFVVGDFTGDGINDVVVLGQSQLTVLTGKGDGTLSQTIPPVSASGQALAKADLDADGAMDVVAVNSLGLARFMNFGPVSISPSSLLWHGVKLGGFGAPKTITVQNLSKRDLMISGAFVGANPEDFTGRGYQTCTGLVHPGATCVINLVFGPQGVGSRSAALHITDNFGNLLSVPLTGTGTP
jgi:hypothetical protein